MRRTLSRLAMEIWIGSCLALIGVGVAVFIAPEGSTARRVLLFVFHLQAIGLIVFQSFLIISKERP